MATTIFQKSLSLNSKLLNANAELAKFIKLLSDHKIDFDKNTPDSLLAHPDFGVFLDELVDTADELTRSPQNPTVPINFKALFSASDAAEEKDVLRYFFNILFEEINQKNPDIFASAPRYLLASDENSPEDIENRDLQIKDYLLKSDDSIGLLRTIHDSLIEQTETARSVEESTTPKLETAAPLSDTSRSDSLGTVSRRKSASSESEAGYESDAARQQFSEAPTSGVPSSQIAENIQKLAAQEAWRDSAVLMNEILNSALGVKDWHELYNSLDSQTQRALDFQIYSIQEDLASTVSLYLLEKPEFARLLTSAKTLSVTDRIAIREALLNHVAEIYQRVAQREYFVMKTEVLKEHLGIQQAFDPGKFKNSTQIADDATLQFAEKLDKEEDINPKNYSALQQKEFKRQLKQIAVLNSLLSADSIDNISQRILTMKPGADGIDFNEFNLLFQGEPSFSLGIEERQALFNEVNSYLKKLRTGQDITDANYEQYRKIQQYRKNNPKEALASMLRDYGIDGVSEKNLRNALDAYVLSLGSPHLLEENLRGLLNSIDPRLLHNSDLLFLLQEYAGNRKLTLAQYTGNNLLTHSLDPDEQTALEFSTQQYQKMLIAYSQMYGADADKILAHALFTRNLEQSTTEDLNEQERVFRVDALKVRRAYKREIERNILAADAQQKAYFAQLFGVDQGIEASGDAAYNNALISAAMNYQPWNAPDGDGNSPQGLRRLRDWLGRAKGSNNLRNQGLQGAANNFISSQAKRVVVGSIGAGAGGAGVGIAIVSQIFGTAPAVIGGAGLGGVAGGIAGGLFIGGPFGAFIGGMVGAISGGFLGFSVSSGFGGPGGAAAAKAVAQKVISSGLTNASAVANAGIQTITASGASIATSTSAVAVGVPLIATSVLTVATVSTVLVAFLPDASTVQVAPYFTTDIVESRYMTVRKTPDPVNADTAGVIKYKIEIAKKPDADEPIVITGIEDRLSALDVNSNPVTPPELPDSVIEQLDAVAGQPLELGEPIIIEFEIDASDNRFNNALFKNDIKVKFTAAGVAEEANARAQTCFGDCPETVLPACWPVTGTTWQPPCATGPKSSPTYNPNASFSHYAPARNVCLDSYDVGAAIGTPVYAMAPGTVVFAALDPRTAQNSGNGYGKIIKIDHGGFLTFYAHQDSFAVKEGDQVQGGQLIGYTGCNGYCFGPHLHFEVVGLQEYVFQNLFGISGKLVPTNGPRCDEYYGVQ